MTSTAIEARGLSKRYRLGEIDGRRAMRALGDRIAGTNRTPGGADRTSADRTEGEIWALRDVSFTVETGEKLGIIGPNGAGKTTLLRILSSITEPTAGEANIYGRVSSLLEVGTGFHGELTGRENIFLNGAILGLSRGEIRRHFDAIVEFSGVEEFLDTPIKRYSSGMNVRLAFAVAAHLQPDILLVDEVLAVGDAEFRKKCLGRMDDVARSGRTILFVSHNMTTMAQICNRAIYLEKGRIAEEGDVYSVIDRYMGSGGEPVAEKSFSEDLNKLVQVARLMTLDSDGRPKANFDCADSLRMVVETLAHEDTKGTVNLAVSSAEGVRICHSICANAIEQYTDFKKGGRLRFEVTFPGGLLNEGQYNFAVWIVPPGEIGSFDAAVSANFRLDDISSPSTFVGQRKARPDLLRLSLDWSVAN